MTDRIDFLHTEDGEIDSWNFDTGNPGISLFANAVQVWSMAQGRPVSLDEAALAFNVQPYLVRQAVEWHAWMFLSGDIIEHEGE